MKAFALFTGFVACLLGMLAPISQATACTVLWYPWNTTYASWDWASAPQSISIDNKGKFPESIKTWKLSVCSADDPSKKAIVGLPSPISVDAQGQHSLDFSVWTPGRFDVSQLESLGEGTFLCAIVGDGRRYSNVSRVNIGHGYQRAPRPGLQVFAVEYPEQDIRRLAVRLVPEPNQAVSLMDLAYPALCVNGTWSRPAEIAWAGQNPLLAPGVPSVRIISLDNYDPPIAPFMKAEVKVKVIEDFDKAFGQMAPMPAGQDHAPVVKKWVEAQKGIESDAATFTVTDTDAVNFDLAFGLK